MWSTAIALVLGASGSAVFAAERGAYEYEMIVLSDTRSKAELPDEVKKARSEDKNLQKILQRREKSRRKTLERLRRIMSEMDQHGYAVVDDSELSHYDDYVKETRELVSVPHELAYVPINTDGSAFANASLVGKHPVFEDKGRVHQMAYVYEFEDLGTVIIDELNFATVPDTRIVVNKPTGNLTINGYPATYTALTDRHMEKGTSSITYITASKLISVTVLKCITKKDREQFARLVEIASSVY